MPYPERTIAPYNPHTDLTHRFPGWRVEYTDLAGDDEHIDHHRQVVKVDPARHGRTRTLTHALGHLVLGHTEHAGRYDAGQEHEAECWADIQLGTVGEWAAIEIDGDPTLA